MLLPLGFLPLMSLRLGKWVLLIPFVLINLMSNYKYQHSIFFQYTYGSGALLFYLAMANFRDLKLPIFRQLRPLFLRSGLFCAVALVLTVGSTKTRYLDRGKTMPSQSQRRPGSSCPRFLPGASVRSSTFFVPQLSMRDEIYLLDSLHPSDYVVLDLRAGYEKDLPDKLAAFQEAGYTPVGFVKNYVALLKHPNASP